MNEKYFAKADFTLFLHQLRVYDHNEQIAHIEQHFRLIEPEFSFYLEGQKIGRIIKEFTFLRPRYVLDFKDWKIQGNFFGLDYEVIDSSGKMIMRFSKELFHFTDHYCLEIYDDENEKLCLLIALAVDLAVCSQSD